MQVGIIRPAVTAPRSPRWAREATQADPDAGLADPDYGHPTGELGAGLRPGTQGWGPISDLAVEEARVRSGLRGASGLEQRQPGSLARLAGALLCQPPRHALGQRRKAA